MSWRAERESEKRVTEQGEVSVVANLRPSLMAKSSAVRMEAEAGNLQAVAVERTGMYIAAPTEGASFLPSSQPKHSQRLARMGMKSFENDNPLLKYTVDHSLRMTDVQKKLMDATLKHPMCYMMGSPEVLQLNANLMQTIGAKKVLDVGVYTGVSTLSAALALPPDGEVHAMDISEEITNVGKPFWREAGVENKIHLHIGPASDSLQRLIDEDKTGTFDFAFIDADKPGYDDYYEKCLVLVRSGGIIAFDNTVQEGKVLEPDNHTPSVVAIRKLNEKLHKDQRINLSFLMIADGLSLCFIK